MIYTPPKKLSTGKDPSLNETEKKIVVAHIAFDLL